MGVWSPEGCSSKSVLCLLARRRASPSFSGYPIYQLAAVGRWRSRHRAQGSSYASPLNPRDAHRGLQLVRPSCPASPLSNAARLTVGHCPGWQMSQDNLGLCALAPMVDATYPTWSMPAVPLVLGSACTWDILAADSHRLRVVLYFVIRM